MTVKIRQFFVLNLVVIVSVLFTSSAIQAQQNYSLTAKNAGDIIALGLVLESDQPITGVFYLPDSSLIALSRGSQSATPPTITEGVLAVPYAIDGAIKLAVHPIGAQIARLRSSGAGNQFQLSVESQTDGATSFGSNSIPGFAGGVAFSPDGAWLAVTGNSSTKEILIYNTKSGELVATLSDNHDSFSLSYSGNGIYLATGGKDTIQVRDAEKGALIYEWNEPNDRVADLAAFGNLIAAASFDGYVYVWDITSGELVWQAQHEGDVYAVAVSPDGSLLASGGQDSVIRLWDVATGEALGTLEGHTNWVRALDFSSDGTFLVSSSGGFGSGENTIRLWGLPGALPVSTVDAGKSGTMDAMPTAAPPTAASPTSASDTEGEELTASFSTAGLTVNYPASWVAREAEDGGIELANSQETMIALDNSDAGGPAPGQVAIIIFAPMDPAEMGNMALEELLSLIASGMASESAETSLADTASLTIGDYEAIHITLTKSGGMDGAFFGMDADGMYVLIVVAAHEGEYGAVESLVLDILGSVTLIR